MLQNVFIYRMKRTGVRAHWYLYSCFFSPIDCCIHIDEDHRLVVVDDEMLRALLCMRVKGMLRI